MIFSRNQINRIVEKAGYKKKHQITGWRYYNHAAIPSTPPHREVELAPIIDGSIWRIEGKRPVLARWIEDWGCDNSDWWYVIIDEPFRIEKLKSKRRYEINKGNRNFTVRRIAPADYRNELLRITIEAYAAWPKKNRPRIDSEIFLENIDKWADKFVVYGAFSKETRDLCGYAYLTEEDGYIDFNVLRTVPLCEKAGINFAIVNKILEDYDDYLKNGEGYVCDGSRSINHETAFQDFLEKYFGFRKMYCILKIEYNPIYAYLIRFFFHIRKAMYMLDSISLIHRINGILKMEEIRRRAQR